MLNKSRFVRIIVSAFVIFAAMLDLATFLLGQKWVAFEVNPIYILTKQAWTIIALKLISISILVWFINNPTKVNKVIYYSILLSAVYMVIFQSLGAYSNVKTQIDQPSIEQVLPVENAVKIYFNIAILYYIVPILISTLAFWLHDIIYVNL